MLYPRVPRCPAGRMGRKGLYRGFYRRGSRFLRGFRLHIRFGRKGRSRTALRSTAPVVFQKLASLPNISDTA